MILLKPVRGISQRVTGLLHLHFEYLLGETTVREICQGLLQQYLELSESKKNARTYGDCQGMLQ